MLLVSQDSFYKSLSASESKLAFASKYDFDSPDAFDYDILYDARCLIQSVAICADCMLVQCISRLKASQSCQIPVYSFVQHQRQKETQALYGGSVVIGLPHVDCILRY